jgi:hypothetical protein
MACSFVRPARPFQYHSLNYHVMGMINTFAHYSWSSSSHAHVHLLCCSLCTNFSSSCAGLITAFSALTPNCSSYGVNLAGYFDFPQTTSVWGTFTLGGSTVILDTNCNSFSPSEEAAIVVAQPAAPTGSCQSLQSWSVCRDYLDYPSSVFVPPGFTLSSLEAKVSSITTLMSVLSTTCARNLGRFLCGQAYMR